MTRIQRSRKTFVLMLAACLLAACEHKPAAPGDVVRASNEAVLQCSVDTDCMLNRVCDGGQCKLATGTSSASMGAQPGAAIEAMVAARRKAGEICLFNNAQILERHYVANLTYEGARLPGCEAETAQYYKLTSALGARTYTLTVTPLGEDRIQYRSRRKPMSGWSFVPRPCDAGCDVANRRNDYDGHGLDYNA